MRYLACVAAGLLWATGAAADDVKKETARLDGTWRMQSLTFNGSDFTGEEGLQFAFRIKDGVGTIEGKELITGDYAKLTFKLDPAAKPKCVDLTVTGGSQKGAKLEGIYELSDDELKLCVKIGGDRPAEFKSPPGESVALVVFKRDKK